MKNIQNVSQTGSIWCQLWGSKCWTVFPGWYFVAILRSQFLLFLLLLLLLQTKPTTSTTPLLYAVSSYNCCRLLYSAVSQCCWCWRSDILVADAFFVVIISFCRDSCSCCCSCSCCWSSFCLFICFLIFIAFISVSTFCNSLYYCCCCCCSGNSCCCILLHSLLFHFLIHILQLPLLCKCFCFYFFLFLFCF